MKNEYFINQLKNILNEYNENDYDYNKILITKARAAIERITGKYSEYYKEFEHVLATISIYSQTSAIMDVITALKEDLEKDYLKSLADIVKSDIFSDYIEMAEHLLSKNYKDPAAVIIGSTLESHIRELCKSHYIDTEITKPSGDIIPKSADTMNQDLTKAGVYSNIYQKQVTAWLGLRNSAAHGKYSDYTESQIKNMLDGVRQFILFTS